MNQASPVALLARTALAVAALSLSGCAIETTPALISAQPADQRIVSVALLGQQDDTSLRSAFSTELTSALSKRSIAIAQQADFIADFAVARRDASLGAVKRTDLAEDEAQAGREFSTRWYHECKPQRVSASLVIFSRASGKVHNRASGEFFACPQDLSQLGNLADLLVAEALSE